ncbi:glycosyltransferase [Pirellula sp. SH-Sr6A]|uniref:glycosyltransferase n=1 Tax=Pirellula sp. SH-Sr6A TaxID=1632865 RepID=UPI0014398280|nr:glycosyltransferase [Pirellula sp. SH-Sr6A]
MKLVVSKLRTLLSSTSYCRWIEELNRCDAVFFAWPYGIECPPCKAPVAFIPHDFNYTHFVGTFVESPASVASLRSQHKLWLERAHPIVSTQFIADELMRTFPEYVSPPRVVRLSQLGPMESMNHDEASKIVQRLGISGDYLLSLNNISAHKNLGQLLSGFHYVAKQYPNLKLVLVGFGTEGIHGNVNSPYYLDWSDSGGNVQSLGLRSDREVSALIARAKLVVNASLYEAGNGSGLDAWRMGTPVVMSDIPAFVEQLHAMDVRAETFNPRCCYEIRDALLRIMQQPEVAEANASYSKKSMSRYSWNDVAEHYLDFFDEIAAKTSHPLDH